MKRSTIGIIVAIVAFLAIGGIVIANRSNKTSQDNSVMTKSMSGDAQSSEKSGGELDLTNETEVTMDIKDFKYEKPKIKIKKGTKVTWTNQDTIKHNVILDNTASGAPSLDEVKPDVFAGPLLAKGESYSFTFTEVTANAYHCSPHPYMKGVVNVIE
jgi:amicyanin